MNRRPIIHDPFLELPIRQTLNLVFNLIILQSYDRDPNYGLRLNSLPRRKQRKRCKESVNILDQFSDDVETNIHITHTPGTHQTGQSSDSCTTVLLQIPFDKTDKDLNSRSLTLPPSSITRLSPAYWISRYVALSASHRQQIHQKFL